MAVPSFIAKLKRAHEHLEGLKHEFETWNPGSAYRITDEFDPKRGHNVIFGERIGDMPGRFSLLIGDCIYDLRASLDHLAFALASTYTRPLSPDLEGASEFPIFNDVVKFVDKAPRKIGGMHPQAQALIEGLQPYHGGHYSKHPLWLLHELSNIDKHRRPHLTALAFVARTGLIANNVSLEFFTDLGVRLVGSEGRTELVHYAATPTEPNQPMKVQFKHTINIAFADTTPALGMSVINTLGAIHNHIRDKIIPPLQPFLT